VPLSKASFAAALTEILEAGAGALLASALREVAQARGMTEIAKSAGITREALYKALRPGSAPRFDTVSRVCAALGVKLVVDVVRWISAWREEFKMLLCDIDSNRSLLIFRWRSGIH
jgi:probable addiction module antidote protein